MINIERFMQSGEKEIYRVIKKRWPIPAMIILCPLWIAFSSIFLISCFKSLFLDAISFDSYGMYLASIFSLIIFVPCSILFPISYILNQLVITNKRIFIRKGLNGKLIILYFSYIVAFQNIHISSKGGDIEKICFFLNNGDKIRTGDLYIKTESLKCLLEILNNKISKKVNTRKQIKELKKDKGSKCVVITTKKLIFPAISTIPFLIALIMIFLYISGYNEKGVQQNVYILGTVKEKHIDSDNNKVTGHKITVITNTGNEKYMIPIDEQHYNMFKESDTISIRAKKGSLGLVYDESFYKLSH